MIENSKCVCGGERSSLYPRDCAKCGALFVPAQPSKDDVLKAGAKDFAKKFGGIMKEWAEEDKKPDPKLSIVEEFGKVFPMVGDIDGNKHSKGDDYAVGYKNGDEKIVDNYKFKTYSKDYDIQKKELLIFIEECRVYDISFQEIADLIGGRLSKQYIHNVYKYGEQGFHNKHLKRKVKKRDKNMCRICKKTPPEILLHIHHIGQSRDHRKKNLVTLCSSCHMKVESLKSKYLKRGRKIKDFSYAQPLLTDVNQLE